MSTIKAFNIEYIISYSILDITSDTVTLVVVYNNLNALGPLL